MKRRDYWKIWFLVVAAIGATSGIISNMKVTPPIVALYAGAMVLGAIALYKLRRRVEEPLYDERTVQIHAKATSATFTIFVLGSFLAGTAMILMGRMGYTGYFQIGSTIFVMAFIFSVMHFVFRIYYRRKYGG
ncbi:MAG: DUF2178 domain-containing protein [Candidatus Bathyarchaeota archaeon]|nr:DUF2178 domain-containing protein [Candidatus Bathyarchaeota archaeon]